MNDPMPDWRDVVGRLLNFSELRPVQMRIEAAALIERQAGEIAKMRGLLQTMIECDPDEPIADGGHVMLTLWRHEARAIRASDEAAGLVLVPRECTVQMMKAFWKAGPYPENAFQKGWTAMIAAHEGGDGE